MVGAGRFGRRLILIYRTVSDSACSKKRRNELFACSFSLDLG